MTLYSILLSTLVIIGSNAQDSDQLDDSTSDSKHYIGELFGGGIVYYIYNNGANGLVASLTDIDGGKGVAWSGKDGTSIDKSAQSYHDGTSNTTAMLAQDTKPNKAATICNSYSHDGFDDWYLPSIWELKLLYNSAFVVSTIFEKYGDPSTHPLSPQVDSATFGRYWSSTEYSRKNAWYFNFFLGYTPDGFGKANAYSVRAFMSF